MASDSIVSTSPQRPSDVVATVPDTDRAGVQQAVEAARAAAADWAATPAVQRADALSAVAAALAVAADEVTQLVVREVGKPVAEAAQEVERGVRILRYHAQAALDPDGETYPAPGGTLLMSRRRPHGVAGLITPWNFPVAIPLWKAAPALAYGNAAVLKPAPESSAIALRLGELLDDALPDGVLRVLTGGGETGKALVELADVVSFTGSVPAGFSVARTAAERGIPAQAEMGGQNASIVLPDADLDAAAVTVAGAAMGYAGQKCTATSRVVVAGDPGPFTEALAAAVRELPLGDPADQRVVVGPVIRPETRDAVVAGAREAADAGGRIVTGGEKTRVGDGWFVAPTVVDRVTAEARVAQEEIFGPICAVLSAADDLQAAAVANGVRYGLVTSIFTADLDRALRLVDRLDTGLIRVNAPTSGVDFYAPFGGEKQSSIGPREQGKAARELYTSRRTITVAPSGR
jgi:acyl-CoA reductase-like NAD-dependent aldehyde dehydrogenase